MEEGSPVPGSPPPPTDTLGLGELSLRPQRGALKAGPGDTGL